MEPFVTYNYHLSSVAVTITDTEPSGLDFISMVYDIHEVFLA